MTLLLKSTFVLIVVMSFWFDTNAQANVQPCASGILPVCAINSNQLGSPVVFNNQCEFDAFNSFFTAAGLQGLTQVSCATGQPTNNDNNPACDTTPETSGPVCGISTSCSYTFTDLCDFQRANRASLKWYNYGFGRCEDLLPQTACLAASVNGTTTTTTPAPGRAANATAVPCNGQVIQLQQNLPLTQTLPALPSSTNFQTLNVNQLPLNRGFSPDLYLPQTANPDRFVPPSKGNYVVPNQPSPRITYRPPQVQQAPARARAYDAYDPELANIQRYLY